jgi:hypothetical protein
MSAPPSPPLLVALSIIFALHAHAMKATSTIRAGLALTGQVSCETMEEGE